MARMLADWIYKLAALMLVGTVVQQAIPEGTYRKYVRLFLGGILTLTMVSSLLTWLQGTDMTRLVYERNDLQRWLGRNSVIEEQWQSSLRQKQEQMLKEPLEAMAGSYGFTCLSYEVEWKPSGEWPEKLTVWVGKQEDWKEDRKEGRMDEMGSDPVLSVENIETVGDPSETTYYEPSELRGLHQDLQTVFQLQEEQIRLYWQRK